jgi:hypothetical protein
LKFAKILKLYHITYYKSLQSQSYKHWNCKGRKVGSLDALITMQQQEASSINGLMYCGTPSFTNEHANLEDLETNKKARQPILPITRTS